MRNGKLQIQEDKSLLLPPLPPKKQNKIQKKGKSEVKVITYGEIGFPLYTRDPQNLKFSKRRPPIQIPKILNFRRGNPLLRSPKS